ncbi:TIGR03668 family PPOX class F420-dependent oxidoreductase [Nonomuraea sp. NPDC049419]|uniref:TIGR03668 family PPOX class F420-dependent oxidoreductase n=1 Tax=Nonomuraea sp. NPDC049419 TaxID=3155772 RepID=UPI003422A3D3
MGEERAREMFAGQPVARMARLAEDGTPRIVPITFALLDGAIVTAVDHKPKTTMRLGRLRDIARDPAVSVLADHYEDDWARLWWVRADGTAEEADDPGTRERALAALAAKYAQYRERPPAGAVIRVEVTRWSAWAASP